MLEIFKKKSRTAAQMREARGQINGAELQAAIDALTAKRREALLTGSDIEVRAIEADLEKARLTFDRASVAAEELDRQISEAESAEADAAFNNKYQAAVTARDAAMAKIDGDYAKGAALILGVIQSVEAANILVEDVNRHLVHDDRGLSEIDEADVLYWRGRYSAHKTRISRTQLLPTHTTEAFGAPADPIFADSVGAWSK